MECLAQLPSHRANFHQCDANKPCAVCVSKDFSCTYDKIRKKRGPAGKRIAEIRRHQSVTPSAPPSDEPLHNPVEPRLSGEEENVANAPPENPGSSGQVATAPFNMTDGEYVPLGPSDSWEPVFDVPESLWSPSIMNTLSGENLDNIQIPSFPIDSPAADDTFASLSESFQESAGKDVWPPLINEESLLPWIDVFFKRLHPTLPILDRTTLYHDMLLRKHKTDKQYGSMLLSLCAFAMTQPVQIEEHDSLPSRTVQARMMVEEAVKMRATADFGETPCIPSILATFFLFACLFGGSRHRAAWHKLREAVDLACSLGMQDLAAYEKLAVRDRDQWIRTYLVLSVTERWVKPE
jgi:hypothetical protein